MTYQAILIASLVLVLAFGIERLGKASGLPAVIVLIVAGLVAKPLFAYLGIALTGLQTAVPILGTVGLVLIVLEGALDIELKPNRIRAAAGAMALAVGGFAACTVVFALAASTLLSLTLFQATVLAIPFAVISSAVAIPSSHFLPPAGREFVVYETSLSDIIGVLVFFALLSSDGSFGGALQNLVGGGLLSLLLSVVFSVGLVLVLMRIDGHIRYIPLLAGLLGLYAAGKLFHLSPLIMVLLFGLVLNNPTLIIRWGPLRGWMDETYEETLSGFKVLILELTFAVRGFFFILLGYWTDLSTLVMPQAWLAATLVLLVAYGSRYLMLRAGRHDLTRALTWIAPRGLITVLLFFEAKEAMAIPDYLEGSVVLIVLLSAAAIALARSREAPRQ